MIRGAWERDHHILSATMHLVLIDSLSLIITYRPIGDDFVSFDAMGAGNFVLGTNLSWTIQEYSQSK